MNKSMVTFFLPTRKGSQRVINKNTRVFAGINGGLYENKIQQLIKSKELSEIMLSTNDEICLEIGEKYLKIDSRLKLIERPEALCLDSTNLVDLISYVPTITKADHILWGHVTTPLAGGDDYDKAIRIYKKKLAEGYDSLISVCELKNFLLDKEAQVINNTTDLPWPRTQDLAPVYEINHVMFMTGREVYLNKKNRIGDKPFLYTMDKISSYDIDWEEDFFIAETLFEKYKKSNE